MADLMVALLCLELRLKTVLPTIACSCMIFSFGLVSSIQSQADRNTGVAGAQMPALASFNLSHIPFMTRSMASMDDCTNTQSVGDTEAYSQPSQPVCLLQCDLAVRISCRLTNHTCIHVMKAD